MFGVDKVYKGNNRYKEAEPGQVLNLVDNICIYDEGDHRLVSLFGKATAPTEAGTHILDVLYEVSGMEYNPITDRIEDMTLPYFYHQLVEITVRER